LPDRAPEPTEQEWRGLYRAADAFKQLAPWQWMLDSDIFGVRNPESGEIGYCCVMGNLGEHLALGVYLGDDGLHSLQRMQAGDYWPPDMGALFIQHCLMASFEDRETLTKRDRDQIKALGLKYRGRQSWPMFQNFTPGYYPWYLNGAEARFLTLALYQSMDVAQRFRDDEDLLVAPVEGQYLVRVQENGEWHDTWVLPNVSEPPAPPAPPVDALQLQRVKQMQLQHGGTWESDYFPTPQIIQEHPDQRPYYVTMGMFVDKRTGMVFPPSLAGPDEWRAAYQSQLLTLIENVGFAPREIHVREDEVRDLLAPVAEPLGIKLRVARRLSALDSARESLLSFLASP